MKQDYSIAWFYLFHAVSFSKWRHYQQLPKCQNHHEVNKTHHTFVPIYKNSQAITELSEHFECSAVKLGKSGQKSLTQDTASYIQNVVWQ
jgi:hypothetical protein